VAYWQMHAFQTLFCCCLLYAIPTFGAGAAPILRYPSPKGDLVVLVERHPEKADTVRLEGASGKVFLTLAVDDEVKEGTVQEGSVLWNAGGDGVAFAAGNSRLFDAHAFIRTNEGWKHLKLPKPGDPEKTVWESYHSVPSKWQGNRLSLAVSGPHGGKPGAPGYSGSMTVAIDVEGGSAKKVGEDIVIVVPDKETR
jgi:hypothetical protein